MLSFLLKRLIQSLFVILAVTLIVAYAIRLTGDPAVMLSQGAGSLNEADLEMIREALGLNKPFLTQYVEFLMGLIQGDFGNSFVGNVPVVNLLKNALPATLLLAFCSMLISIIISIPLGIFSAVRRGKFADQLIRLISLVGLSFPNFGLAIVLVLFFSSYLQWLPASGKEEITSVLLPALTMGIILTATNVRLVRTSMLETLGTQYVMVARAKGLSERVVLYKHALRNCSIPLITFFGLQFGGLLGGVVIIEKVFNWPGLGSLAMDAISERNYPVLQGVIVVLALMIVFVNLLVDIAYGLVDPRIRHK